MGELSKQKQLYEKMRDELAAEVEARSNQIARITPATGETNRQNSVLDKLSDQIRELQWFPYDIEGGTDDD